MALFRDKETLAKEKGIKYIDILNETIENLNFELLSEFSSFRFGLGSKLYTKAKFHQSFTYDENLIKLLYRVNSVHKNELSIKWCRDQNSNSSIKATATESLCKLAAKYKDHDQKYSFKLTQGLDYDIKAMKIIEDVGCNIKCSFNLLKSLISKYRLILFHNGLLKVTLIYEAKPEILANNLSAYILKEFKNTSIAANLNLDNGSYTFSCGLLHYLSYGSLIKLGINKDLNFHAGIYANIYSSLTIGWVVGHTTGFSLKISA